MMDTEILQKAYETGFEFERKYHGCAQCVIAAVYRIFPEMRSEDIFRSATTLAGGVGLTARGSCGALAGAGMVLSQLFGRSLGAVEDPEKTRFRGTRMHRPT